MIAYNHPPIHLGNLEREKDMTDTNKWHFVNHYSPYYDYEKELYSIPDEINTSVDIRLTFDADYHTCYYNIILHNDNGDTIDWEKSHHIPWNSGMAMLAADGVTFFQEASKLGDNEAVPEELG